MSTSCMIRFTSPDHDRVAQIYKHLDGYPEQVIEQIKTLRTVVTTTGCLRGPTYAAAQFVTVEQLQQLLSANERSANEQPDASLGWLTALEQPSGLLGLGVADSRNTAPPDIAYVYEIVVPDLNSPTTWIMKISPELDLDGPNPVDSLYDAVEWQRVAAVTGL